MYITVKTTLKYRLILYADDDTTYRFHRVLDSGKGVTSNSVFTLKSIILHYCIVCIYHFKWLQRNWNPQSLS